MSGGWRRSADVVVVGSGVAGLTAALTARRLGLRVTVVTKSGADEGSTRWAQGGLAVVLPADCDDHDSIERHIADTLAAGGELCHRPATAAIIGDGPAAVGWLRGSGAVFDLDEDGRLARTREGGHTAFRVVHAGGDATGAEVQRTLLAAARASDMPLLERHTAVEVLRGAAGQVRGLLALDAGGEPGTIAAPAVVLATGGSGQLFQTTTNPDVATGDGLALALRAGASVADVEFVQFHPTVLAVGDATGRRPLVTEAVRGEGGVLRDLSGQRVMAGVHPLEDLAPRDVVSAAVTRRMAATGTDHVMLDVSAIPADRFSTRFPTVYAACRAAGIDPAGGTVPVAPAAHFACGGVVAGVDGRTEVPGLYAVGETARTGLHGANRLASNSLLEGLTVAHRTAHALARDLARAAAVTSPSAAYDEPPGVPVAPVADRATVQRVMTRHAAIGRDAEGLAAAAAAIAEVTRPRALTSRRLVEDAALTLTARMVLAAAACRTESRGCHVRTDHPEPDPAWRRTIRLRLDGLGEPVSSVTALDDDGQAA